MAEGQAGLDLMSARIMNESWCIRRYPQKQFQRWKLTTEDPRRLASDEAVGRAAQALEDRNVRVLVADTAPEALERLKEIVPRGAQVLAVTSETLDGVGFTQYVAESGAYDSLAAKFQGAATPEERAEMSRTLGSVPEYVVGSVQAVAETGHVVIASASGSQLQQLCVRGQERGVGGGHS